MKKAKKPNVFEPHDTVRMQALRGIPLASFRSRASAFMLDLVIVVLAAVLAIAATRPGIFRGSEPVHFELFKSKWGIGLVVLCFGFLPRIWRGRTPGKWIFKLRMVSLSHDRLTLWQCVERALGYGFSSLEGGFGFIQYFQHPNRQTLHDRIAETIVISERKKGRRAASPLLPRDDVTASGRSSD